MKIEARQDAMQASTNSTQNPIVRGIQNFFILFFILFYTKTSLGDPALYQQSKHFKGNKTNELNGAGGDAGDGQGFFCVFARQQGGQAEAEG